MKPTYAFPGFAQNAAPGKIFVKTKPFLLFFLSLVFPVLLSAQSKDCKFIKLKNADGITNGVVVTSQAGKLYVTRWQGKYAASFVMRDFYTIMADNQNMTTLRIDSVEFIFTNNQKVVLKVTGSGSIKNSNSKLKPVFDTISFNLVADAAVVEKYFSKITLKGFLVHGESNSVYGDTYNDKQQAEGLQAFNCLLSQ